VSATHLRILSSNTSSPRPPSPPLPPHPALRSDFLCSKVINDEKDDLDIEEDFGEGSSSNIIIAQTDFDYLPVATEDDEEEKAQL